MDMTPVPGSKQIKAIGYDPAAKTLAVQFLSGGTYHYADVPPELAGEFEKAPSKGSFLHHQIKGKYTHTKVG
jgi:KTSC domain